MAKLLQLKNILIRQGIIMSVVVLVSLAFAYAAYFWLSGAVDEEQRLASRFRSVEGEITQRTGKNADALKYLELYERITGTSEQEKISDLSRERAQRWLIATAQELDVKNLEGSFEPVVEIDSPALKKNTLQGIYSQVKLRFGAMSDITALRFAETVLNEFPGYVKVTRFQLVRKGDITNTVLQDAAKGTFTEMVNVEMEFLWIGVREVAKPASANAARGSDMQ